MGSYILIGFVFAILLGACCIGCAAKDWAFVRKYEDMLDEHEDVFENV